MIAATGGALHLTDTSFESEVLKSNKPALVDFTATWCGPCRVMNPLVDELAREFEGKAVVGKVDLDESPETAMNYGVRSAPTILFFKNGEIVDQIIGAVGKEKMRAKLAEHLI